jgi:hypothetical protein
VARREFKDGADPAKFIVIGIGVALVAAAVGIVIWSTTPGRGRADISGRVVVVEVGDEREMAVTLEVEKAPLASASCDVSAFDSKGKSVGRLTGVVIGPNNRNERVTRMVVSVPTPLGEGTTASVAVCRITRTR